MSDRRAFLSQFLTPPRTCEAMPTLTCKDKRKGAIWHCMYGRRIVGKGRKHPGCLCAEALNAAAIALAPPSTSSTGEG